MRVDVGLRGLTGMMGGLRVMAVRGMGVVRGFFVVTGRVVLGGFPMMPGGMLVVLGGAMMMIGGFLGHDVISSLKDFEAEPQRG